MPTRLRRRWWRGAWRVAPDAAHVNDYVKARKEPPKFNAESWLVLGTILGGMAAARTLGGRGDAGIDEPAGAEPKRSPLASAAGGAMLMFGARMAAGSGRREGVWAMAGMLAAAAAFIATYPRLKTALEAGSLGRVNLLGGHPVRPALPPLDVVVRPRAADTGWPTVR